MKEFGPQVASNSQGFLGNITKLIPMSSILDKFKSFLPLQGLTNLTSNSTGSMAEAAKKLLPSMPSLPGAGGLGGIF